MKQPCASGGTALLPPRESVIDWSQPRTAVAVQKSPATLPFTTPALIHMRVQAARGGGLEMLLGNPSGGRGVYVARWAALRRYAQPSLHDILLAERIEQDADGAAGLTPNRIRLRALELAAEGHCGRKIALAAKRTQQAEAAGLQRCCARLVRASMQAFVAAAGDEAGPDWSEMRNLAAAGRAPGQGWLLDAARLLAPRLLAPRLREPRLLEPRFRVEPVWQPDELAAAFADLGRLSAPLGDGLHDEGAFLPRVHRLLSLSPLLQPTAPQPMPQLHARLRIADEAFDRAYKLTADLPDLLSAWRKDPVSIARTIEAPAWALAGYDRLCLLPVGSKDTLRFAQSLAPEGPSEAGVHRREPESLSDGALAGVMAPFSQTLDTISLRLREIQLQDGELDLKQFEGEG